VVVSVNAKGSAVRLNKALPTKMPAQLGLRVAKDLAAVGGGTALATVFGTIIIFVIPRLVSVEDFGYWRIFLLYSGYVGFLHLGFLEGALLSWAGDPLSTIRQQLRPALKFVALQQISFFAIGTLISLAFLRPAFWLVSIAVLTFAVLLNTTTFLLFAFQAAREFGTVALAVSIPTGGFLALALVFHFAKLADYRMLIASYLLGWVSLLLFLWMRLQPLKGGSPVAAGVIARRFITSGWPIMLSSLAYCIVQSADRIVVSATTSIYGFAQYSLAASVMAVPIAAIAAVARVSFPHLAAIDPQHHQRAYHRAAVLAFLCWSLSVPYYFVLERVVQYMLPKYIEGLPYAKILLCGSVFLGSIQILQLSFSNIYRRQRQFLIWASGAVFTSLLLALVAATRLHSLEAVAASQVVSVLIWWQINEWNLRDISGQGLRDWIRLLFLFGWSALSFWVALKVVKDTLPRIAVYYALTSASIGWIGFRELFFCWRVAVNAYQRRRNPIQFDHADGGSATKAQHYYPAELDEIESVDPSSA
jgi:O-antigen/teichoic acid export membrane protein